MRTVLVANRGEIAVRIVRACHDAGLRAVGVYSDVDAGAPHTLLADEAVALSGGGYLSAAAILDAAAFAGADAVHPGYGFLSEDAGFAQAVIDAGLVWVGPSPESMRALGDKVSARSIARRVGAPMAPGTTRPVEGAAEVEAFAAEHGFPVAIKAAFGGGGRGLKVVHEAGEIAGAFESAVREATAAFGRGECFVERFLPRARHVEVQILADSHGAVSVLGTRDCTVQRRNQKLIEEAPAPFLSDDLRTTLHESATAICREAGYTNAGTVEFLVADDGTTTFLEVNTRLQVEHPATEEVTGVDVVGAQLRIAAGEPLDLPADVPVRGHAIEFRINAEDADRGFAPAPGTVTRFDVPSGPGVRVDSGIAPGGRVGAEYDSLLAKVIVSGRDRAQALARARRVLAEIRVEGVRTVLDVHRDVLADPAFTGTDSLGVYTRWVEEEYLPRREPPVPDPTVGLLRLGRRTLRVSLPGMAELTGASAEAVRAGLLAGADRGGSAAASPEQLVSPMQGTVVQLAVSEGQQVAAGDVVAVVEAMKMENAVRATVSGTVTELPVKIGDSVAQDALLCRLEVSAADPAPA
ncbi:biotin carboxylase N-terminal domain-containing protein [Pseudonocardia sp. N23]|uniref:acetyl/propionyl/methylcrotonyl-CoA carboxylase subunit alpha n=1 Tax=Pseudonocardia sp. N23 TaxID=1987376 RepID=UPI000BFCF5E8|nr:biotin carboxylase N-terminal domain-containing protein [Pseudonocardia sp. N23]GAY10056.1 biotin carboxylase of acetyl-CoA carboxylase [Pseudonocardia sp. N23]